MKRYVRTIQEYFYAENDEDAIKQTNNLIKERRDKFDNQASVVNIFEKGFASPRLRNINL